MISWVPACWTGADGARRSSRYRASPAAPIVYLRLPTHGHEAAYDDDGPLRPGDPGLLVLFRPARGGAGQEPDEVHPDGRRGHATGRAGRRRHRAGPDIPLGAWANHETRLLGSLDPKDGYKLAVEVDNITGGINSVRLLDYTESVTDHAPVLVLAAPDPDPDHNVLRPYATVAITLNGIRYGPTRNDISRFNPDAEKRQDKDNPWERLTPAGADGPFTWTVISTTRDEIRLRHTFGANGTLQAQIDKVFRLRSKGTYDIEITHEIHNMTDGPLVVSIDQLGPTDLADDSFQTDPRGFTGVKYVTAHQYIDSGHPVFFGRLAVQKAGELPKPFGDFQGTDHLVWLAASNRFFTAIMRPLPRGLTFATEPIDPVGAIPVIDYLGAVQLEQVMEKAVPRKTEPDRTVGVALAGREITLAPKASTTLGLITYIGPKKHDILEGDLAANPKSEKDDRYHYALYHYSSIIRFNQSTCCFLYSFLTFDWLAYALLWLLDALHVITFGNYGIAIMLLVIVVRLLMHPLTRYSQVSMAKMQRSMAAIQPEIDRVKKKYEKDKSRQQQELMKVYKDHNVNPAGGIMGCLPMLLQMPIWIALYSGLAAEINLRHAPFISGWINDLSNPDAVLPIPPRPIGHPLFTMPLLGDIYGLNLLPLLLGLVFFIQMRMTAKIMPVSGNDQQAQTQKISQWMIMLFPVFLYNAPSGLNLYIFASTLGGLFDSWLVRRHLREQGLLPAPAPAK